MAYNFGSAGYEACFNNVPTADGAKLRAAATEFLKKELGDLKACQAKWGIADPVRTLLKGEGLPESADVVDTVDAFNRANGKQLLSPAHEVDLVIGHIHNFAPARTDLRTELRAIDWTFMTQLAGEIIANQCADFGKQDGVTEVEESIQANLVEQRLNDELMAAEARGEVLIRRSPVLVGCVSNFSNFLDLCRKVFRHLEVGIPVVVFSRSNTGQHHYRWTQLLLKLLKEYHVDLGMVTFLSCSIEEQRRLCRACPQCPMHFTGSREVASKIKEVVPKLLASTGGPNTMVVNCDFNDAVADAARWSNLIENKGQCTAMRHLVTPAGIDLERLDKMYSKASTVPEASAALAESKFAEIIRTHLVAKPEEAQKETYQQLKSQPLVNVRISDKLPVGIQEKWRQLFLDVTTGPAAGIEKDAKFLADLALWLNTEQPITLAVNSAVGDYALALKLFASTGLVVYTVGDAEKPALTAQARPQDGECFGEFPPRHLLPTVTSFPMIIPSPVAAYNSVYSANFLQQQAQQCAGKPGQLHTRAAAGWAQITSPPLRGYATLILEYLLDATQTNPKRGCGTRTTLFGLQRPPVDAGLTTVLRLEVAAVNSERLFLYLLPFLATTAFDQVQVSLGLQPSATLLASLTSCGLSLPGSVSVESRAAFEQRRTPASGAYNSIVVDDAAEPALAQQFVSRLFPMGHIKSTRENDVNFVKAFEASPKWLRVRRNEL